MRQIAQPSTAKVVQDESGRLTWTFTINPVRTLESFIFRKMPEDPGVNSFTFLENAWACSWKGSVRGLPDVPEKHCQRERVSLEWCNFYCREGVFSLCQNLRLRALLAMEKNMLETSKISSFPGYFYFSPVSGRV